MPDSPAPIRFGTLAGIRTVAVPGAGPFRATLTFRVGRTDESFATGGITHFVEHLALSGPISSDDVEHNGYVDPTTTAFWASGERERVLAHLQRVVHNLAKLPLERMETERDILRAEMDGWSPGPIGLLAAYRFGARAQGLIGYPQFGLRTITGACAQTWADQWFTRDNAVLVVQGEPPRALDLPLPDGRPRPPAPTEPIPWRTYPSETRFGVDGVVALGMLAPRTAAAAAASRILQDRMMEQLRHDAGVSYSPATTWIPLNATVAHLALCADVRDPASAATARDLLEALCADLVERGPSEKEMRTARTPFDEAASPAQIAGSWAHYVAHQALFGMPRQSLAEHRREVGALTAQELRDAFAHCHATRLVLIPPDVRPGSLRTMQRSSPRRIEGTAYQPVRTSARPIVSMTAGSDGLTFENRNGRFTVGFGECVGALTWHDGTRAIFDRDGISVEVDPSEWRNGTQITALIDERIPAALVVPMDQELARRAEHVAAATRDLVRRTDATALALDLLPEVLQDGEIVEAAAEAAVEGARGVVAVTDWRLVFVASRDSFLILHRGDIVEAAYRRGSQILGGEAKLTLTMDDGTCHHVKLTAKGQAAAQVDAALRQRTMTPAG